MKRVLLPFFCLLVGSMVASAQATIASAVFTSPATLTPGANNTIVITVTWNPDNADMGLEWLDQFRVNFPAGFVVQTTGNSNTGAATPPAMTPSGSSMIVGIVSPVAAGSQLGPIARGPFTITVNVAVPAGFTGALAATYTAIGDGYDDNAVPTTRTPTASSGSIGGTAPLPVQLVAFSGYHSAQGVALDRKSTRLNSSHRNTSRMPSSA